MLEFLFRTKVTEASDMELRNKIQEKLRENNIDFTVKVKDINHRNSYDAARMGQGGISPKYVYSFWVKKEQADLALHVVKQIGR